MSGVSLNKVSLLRSLVFLRRCSVTVERWRSVALLLCLLRQALLQVFWCMSWKSGIWPDLWLILEGCALSRLWPGGIRG